MSGVDGEPPEDLLADVLAAYDDRLAAGTIKPHDSLDEAVDPALLPDWNRLTSFLSLVEKAWPRGGRDSDHLTISDPDGRTEPALTQGSPLRENAEATALDAGNDRRFGHFQKIAGRSRLLQHRLTRDSIDSCRRGLRPPIEGEMTKIAGRSRLLQHRLTRDSIDSWRSGAS
jgi:hypothetical protein